MFVHQHVQHRYLQDNLEMQVRDHYPDVTNPKSYVITLSFQEIILMAENHYPKIVENYSAHNAARNKFGVNSPYSILTLAKRARLVLFIREIETIKN